MDWKTGSQLPPESMMGFLFPSPLPDRFWGTPRLLSIGYGVSYRGKKRPGREVDHSAPSSAMVEDSRSCTSTPQYIFAALCLVKHRNNFTVTLRTIIIKKHEQNSRSWQKLKIFGSVAHIIITFIYCTYNCEKYRQNFDRNAWREEPTWKI